MRISLAVVLAAVCGPAMAAAQVFFVRKPGLHSSGRGWYGMQWNRCQRDKGSGQKGTKALRNALHT